MRSLPSEWRNVQPRYAAYCITFCAKSREEMVERDAAIWPGGKMVGFMLWNAAVLRKWEKARGVKPGSLRSAADQSDFTEWVVGKALAIWSDAD